MVRGNSFNQKGKGVRGRSKSRLEFRDLKKNQSAFCKELGHWMVDCPRIKDKNKGKESKTEANLTQVINTQSGCTSQVDGSDPDLSVCSFSVTTPTIGYSGDSEWMIDTGATYHVCPDRDWFLVLRN